MHRENITIFAQTRFITLIVFASLFAMTQALYSGDTFFHLSPAGQYGLAAIALLLAGLSVAVMLWISKRLSLWGKLVTAIAVFWWFEWLSPQVFYVYYWMIMDGLPMQLVVNLPPSPQKLLAIMSFTGPATISAHSRGILFLVMLLLVLWKWYQERRP